MYEVLKAFYGRLEDKGYKRVLGEPRHCFPWEEGQVDALEDLQEILEKLGHGSFRIMSVMVLNDIVADEIGCELENFFGPEEHEDYRMVRDFFDDFDDRIYLDELWETPADLEGYGKAAVFFPAYSKESRQYIDQIDTSD